MLKNIIIVSLAIREHLAVGLPLHLWRTGTWPLQQGCIVLPEQDEKWTELRKTPENDGEQSAPGTATAKSTKTNKDKYGSTARKLLDVVCFCSVLMLSGTDLARSRNITARTWLSLARQMGKHRSEFTRRGELTFWRQLHVSAVTDKANAASIIRRDSQLQPQIDSYFVPGQYC
jgi:hypothetical protein